MYKRLPYLALVLSLVFATSLRAESLGAVVVSWDIDFTKNTVTLHLLNDTGKDITAYNIKIRETYGQRISESELSMDSVDFVLNIRQSTGTAEGGEWRHHFDNGPFPSGSTRDEVTQVQPGLTDFSAAVDTVIYADKTTETTNPDALKRLLGTRAAFAASIQAANDIIQKALANPDDPNPQQTALKQIESVQSHWEANHHQVNLNAALHEVMEANLNALALHEVMGDLKHAGTAAAAHRQSIRDYLNNYVAERNERAARLLEQAEGGAQ